MWCCGCEGIREDYRSVGSEFKGEISDAGCDHPFSSLLPALTLVSAVFSACTSLWAFLLLHFVLMLCSMEYFGKSSFR